MPAIKPDFTIFHAPLADHLGNVYLGRQQELKLLAHASKQTLVTVEEIVNTDLLSDSQTAPATIPSFYLSNIAKVIKGAHPLNLPEYYETDLGSIQSYASAARSTAGFMAWLKETLTINQTAA